MKGMLIPTDGRPHAIDIQRDENGSALHDLQRLVDGYIEPFDVIFGENICLYVNIVAVGFDPETGMDRDLTGAEMAQVSDYFTKVSAPGSGLAEALAIQQGRRREDHVQERGVSLKGEADASRDASDALGGGPTSDTTQHGMEGR